ncbi:14040_t:CDS:1, partial [Cetraspora pellucida]
VLGTKLDAILVQNNKNNKEYIVDYASKRFTKTEHNYSASELKCLV